MLRILFSRSAIFPALGIVLMLAGAVFPDESTAAIILIVVGANVAFYSLRDFSQNFAWGEQSRAMLRLCGFLFPIGLFLIAVATTIDPRHRSIAILCTGLYLGLFAVWCVQQIVSWRQWVLSFLGILLLMIGGIAGNMGRQDWRLFSESKPDPQEVTLAELLERGHGDNRYLHLKDFRFCDHSVAEKENAKTTLNDLWVPLVAVDGQAVKANGPVPPIPARIEVVTTYLSLGGPEMDPIKMGLRRSLDLLRKQRETNGYECTVVTGIKTMNPHVREQLGERAPQTDFDDVIVLDWRKPASADRVYGTLGVGAVGLLLGFLLLTLVYRRAWRVVNANELGSSI